MILLLGCLAFSDHDGDGVTALMGDCDDDNGDVFPGAEELCNGLDDDCDGSIDGFDAVGSGYLDADGDGYGTDWLCEPSLDLAPTGGDCNDGDPAIHPGADEVCNEVDDDCDGVADDGAGPLTWWPDSDGDGYGDLERATLSQCEQPIGYSGNSRDCDDEDPLVHAGNSWFLDADGDGYGDPAVEVLTCTPDLGYVDNDLDCDDLRSDVSPDGQEVCDPDDADEDCDGLVDDADDSVTDFLDWYEDADGDGLGNVLSWTEQCEQPEGYVDNSSDCDDDDVEVGSEACAIVELVPYTYERVCALYGDGTVYCFDKNISNSGWLGESFVSLQGDDQTGTICGVRPDGTTNCNRALKGAYLDVAVPYATSGASEHWLGVRTDGTLECHLGEGFSGGSFDPCSVSSDADFIAVRASQYESCAQRTNGTIQCWGWTTYWGGTDNAVAGGLWDLDYHRGSTILASGEWSDDSSVEAVDVSCHGSFCCVADVDGDIHCTNGDPVMPAATYVQVAAAFQWVCGGTDDGRVLCGGLDTGDGLPD